MNLTHRQKKILNTIVEEYINSAVPVSSQLLEKKHDFGICPASIRIEMQKLTDKGYLKQPHTSAGRVPTDKSYRFFVDELLSESEKLQDTKFFKEMKEQEEEFSDPIRFFQYLTKRMADLTSGLALGYLFDEDIFLKEGWGQVAREPEFSDIGYFSRFAEMIEDLEENIEQLDFSENPQVYIGSENPVPECQDFSMIASKCELPEGKKGLLAVFGPKRMEYEKSITLFNSLSKFFD